MTHKMLNRKSDGISVCVCLCLLFDSQVATSSHHMKRLCLSHVFFHVS